MAKQMETFLVRSTCQRAGLAINVLVAMKKEENPLIDGNQLKALCAMMPLF